MRNFFVNVYDQNRVRLDSEEIDPDDLAPDELLIETEWTFISSGTELANYTGVEPQVWQEDGWCKYPWRSGYANVGTVRAKGSAAVRAEVGQRVFTYAKHESWAKFKEERLVYPVPDSLPGDIAVASRMAGVAATSILVPEIKGSPTVVVFGLGIVGNLASQLYGAIGCRVIAVDPVAERRALAARVGVAEQVGGPPDEVQDRIMELTGGTGADIVVEAVGHSAVCMQALDATRRHGQLVILGTPRAPVDGNLTDFFGEMHYRCIKVLGALEWQYPFYPAINTDTSQYQKQKMIFEWLEDGRIQLEPLISHRMHPEGIEEAYQGLLNQKDTYTGVALEWK